MRHSLGTLIALLSLVAIGTLRAEDATSTVASAPNKWALLLGINDYSELSDLKYCRRDTQMLQNRLIAAGFTEKNIVLMHDDLSESRYQPFKAHIEKNLDSLLTNVGPRDMVLFAFSGHGVDLDGTRYLCPVEASLDSPETTMLSMSSVYRKLAACRARQKLLLIDACRNDPRTTGERSLDSAPDLSGEFVRSLQTPPEGLVVLSSCTPGQVSVEDDKMGHGVFMHFVLRGFAGEADCNGGNENGVISLFELFRYASVRTRAHVARTRDLPQTPRLWGEITSDFPLSRVPRKALEVETVWATIRENREKLARDSLVIQRLQLGHARQLSRYDGMVSSSVMASMKRETESLQAVVLTNPALITARDPAALVALQRALAFGLRGDYDGMIAAATEALRLEPTNPFGYLLRGMALSARSSRHDTAASMVGMHGGESLSDYQVESLAKGLESPEGVHRGSNYRIAAARGELIRANPHILADLRAANSDLAKKKQILESAIDKLRNVDDLTRALSDYQRVGAEIVAMVNTGSRGTTRDFAHAIVLRSDGGRLLVRRIDGTREADTWVSRDKVTTMPILTHLESMIDMIY